MVVNYKEKTLAKILEICPSTLKLYLCRAEFTHIQKNNKKSMGIFKCNKK